MEMLTRADSVPILWGLELQAAFAGGLSHPFLLEENVSSARTGEILELTVEGHDVYNITAPVRIGAEVYIFGRVEKRETEEGSRICAFKKVENRWVPIELNLPPLQDPAIAIIHGKVVLSGIKVNWITLPNGHREAENYWTEFFILDESLQATWLTRGPDRMKDIRLFELDDGVGAFTRPYELHKPGAGGGKIGFTRFANLAEIRAQALLDAPLIDVSIPDGEWMGANSAQVVDGCVWVLGHVGRWVGTEPYRIREYDAVIFVFNPVTGKCSEVVTVAKHSEFNCAKQKNSQLRRIVFSGGFEISEDGKKLIIYVGLNDVASGRIEKPNLFPALARTVQTKVPEMLIYPVVPQD